MVRNTGFLITILILASGLIIHSTQTTPTTTGVKNEQPGQPATTSGSGTPATAPIALSAPLPPLPSELQGLEPDSRLATDEYGNLLPTPELRRLFDFHLANLDREPLGLVLQRIQSALNTRLAEPAEAQALALLERYVDYRMAVGELQERLPGGVTMDGFDVAALRQRQAGLDALRQDYFGAAESAAFFGRDQQLDDFTLARLEIEQNTLFDPDEKKRQLQILEQQLPENVQRARTRATINADLYQQTDVLKRTGASKTELYQLRAGALGETAATRLAVLDEQQKLWQDRLSQYNHDKARIQQSGLSPTDRDKATESLRNRLFNGPEQLRVRALETLDQ
ncbi:hypothetical protein FWJ25_13320 [Marinobacter salinexigens]|uniref:Lipase chaperone n=1 Tax=Marinobacter salinexigens TaxID=2919747 RepID=A0A5B0VFI7_9GAMM|nr:lipase secretion chaperone [Marinobacter salinexigens]KAA1172789.1 hypothetical protein FWJ25_13320 [Marinobacter salinexigens]